MKKGKRKQRFCLRCNKDLLIFNHLHLCEKCEEEIKRFRR